MSVARSKCKIEGCEKLQKSDGRKKSGVQKYKTICGYHYNQKHKVRKLERMKEKYGREYAETMLNSLAQEVEKLYSDKNKAYTIAEKVGKQPTNTGAIAQARIDGYKVALNQVLQLIRERR